MENIQENIQPEVQVTDTPLDMQVTEQISQNLIEAKLAVESRGNTLGSLLKDRVTRNYKVLDSERVETLFNETITKINEKLNYLLNYYQISEREFYSKNSKTADLIFNTLCDKRTKRIYLDNLLKKIEQKPDEDIASIFTHSIKDIVNVDGGSDNINSEKNLSIDSLFNQFIHVLVNYSKLSNEDAEDLRELMQHYYNLYKGDVSLAIKKLLEANKNTAILKIESEIDKREIRNGKTRAVAMIEKSIINNSQNKMNELLINTISNYRKAAVDELKICSSSIVEVIFRLLPMKYQDQVGLLEIIIDTNINERLGNLLDAEIKKLADNLRAKNQDIIVNELYEEKRYKKIEDYSFDFSLVEKVYQDILHEIRISYDIQPDKESQKILHAIRESYNIEEPEEDEDKQSKRLNLLILSESNSTKNIFKNLVDAINMENERNLKMVILEMHRLSQEAQGANTINNEENFGQKK